MGEKQTRFDRSRGETRACDGVPRELCTSATRRANPKPHSFNRPSSSINTFDGFKSQCT
jgi:hypothetical protein